MADEQAVPTPSVSSELLKRLGTAYAELLRRQGHAASPFVRWSQVTGRVTNFSWLGGALERETLMFKGEPLVVRANNRLFADLDKMRTAITFNPYERELLYGYPYVIGRRAGDAIRGPILVMPVQLEGEGDEIRAVPAEEVVRFNSLPFRRDGDPEASEVAIRRVMERTPAFPLLEPEFRVFIDTLVYTLGVERREARLDGMLGPPPPTPIGRDALWLIDQAAIFIAPKTAYFLTSDLEKIANLDPTSVAITCFGDLLARSGAQPQVDISTETIDRSRIYYPFPSNRSQRRVSLLVDDPTTRVIRVEGPPGTGKSLTIANLACHLAATGRSVLITSQKDKALEVVDQKLRTLDLAELPMTLLRQDKASKQDLRDRLGRIKKERPSDEVQREFEALGAQFSSVATGYLTEAAEFGAAVGWEALIERVDRSVQASNGLRRLIRQAQLLYTGVKANRAAPRGTHDIAASATTRREQLRALAFKALQRGRELAVATATRAERQGLRELSQILKRDQTSAKNFSLFDRLKEDPDRAGMLLKLLPVWILAPEDVARLFPCRTAIFNVVIVDEASQVDLPSIAPIVYRGQKLVIFGDSKQMQPRRFLFMNQNVIAQAWQQAGMHQLDSERWLHPTDNSLLTLSTIRAQEETLLEEHYRSLPPIIQFSNAEYYNNQLRIMTDEQQKAFGGPDQPITELHYVPDGKISNGSQENEAEALTLVGLLAHMVRSEDYAEASIGVIALFEEQAALLQELVRERIPEEEWDEHNLVVVTPDGFQGDERDVILYSLSWDNAIMPRQALSQRQRNHPHEQGMLNVGFTRARDEIHIFHSAPIQTFTLADGRDGALTRWLKHCAAVQAAGRVRPADSPVGDIDSEFEAEVAAVLREHNLRVFHQYPACGFHIDLVCDKNGTRVAVECDGEQFHRDEFGQPKLEDLERDAILRRAGWKIVRIPYRQWRRNPTAQLNIVIAALDEEARADTELEVADLPPPLPEAQMPTAPATDSAPAVRSVSLVQEAVIKSLREGLSDEAPVLYRVRDLLGSRRLTSRFRQSILAEIQQLRDRGLVAIEDHAFFLTAEGRTAQYRVVAARLAGWPSRRYQRRRYHRRRF